MQSVEQDSSEKTVSEQPGNGEAGGDEQQGAAEEPKNGQGSDSVEVIPDPLKRKATEEEEVSKPSPRKKTKASNGKDVIEDPFLTTEELDEALTCSTEGLT